MLPYPQRPDSAKAMEGGSSSPTFSSPPPYPHVTALHLHSNSHTPVSRIFHEEMSLWPNAVFHITFRVSCPISVQDGDNGRQLLSKSPARCTQSSENDIRDVCLDNVFKQPERRHRCLQLPIPVLRGSVLSAALSFLISPRESHDVLA